MLPETAGDLSAGRALMLREVAVVEAGRADSWVIHEERVVFVRLFYNLGGVCGVLWRSVATFCNKV